MFTTEKIKDLVNNIDLTPGKGLCKAIYEYSGILSDNDKHPLYEVLSALRNDLLYDPDPFISTLDYKPEDRLAGIVSGLWTDELTDELHNLCTSEINGGHAEDFFRWHRYDAMKRIECAADKCKISLPEKTMLSFYCPYAFARLYMAGFTDAGSGVLLRRVNCRPWGIKPINV